MHMGFSSAMMTNFRTDYSDCSSHAAFTQRRRFVCFNTFLSITSESICHIQCIDTIDNSRCWDKSK